MSVKISPPIRQQFENTNGVPYAGGKLFTYAAGSSTKQATYTDSTGLTANTNPIILDVAGRTPYGLWLTAGLNYKFVLALSTDTDPPSSPILTEDVVSGVNDTATATSQWIASAVTPTYISATQFTLLGDKTIDFHVGRRLKFTVTAGTVYARITASAYTTLTTVTISGGALDTGLSSVDLSILTATNPSIPALSSTDITAIGAQPLDATLSGLAALVIGANEVPVGNGVDTFTKIVVGTLSGNIPLVGTVSATETLSGLSRRGTTAEAQAGTEDTAPTTSLKTAQAIAALGLGGSAQSWQNVLTTPGRAITTTFTNSSGKPIEILVSATLPSGGGAISLIINSATVGSWSDNLTGTNMIVTVSAIIPNLAQYSISVAAGSPTVAAWWELR